MECKGREIRLLYIFIFFLCTGRLYGQQKVLIERFTNTSCFQCAEQVESFDAITEAKKDSVIVLNYHLNRPRKDIFFENPRQIQNRKEHYDVKYIPSAYINGRPIKGKYYDGAPANLTTETLKKELKIEKLYPFSIDYEFDETVENVIVRLNCQTTRPDTENIRMHVALAEHSVKFFDPPGLNGLRKFKHIFKRFITPEEGITYAEFKEAADENGTIEWTVPIPYMYKVEELEVIAFVSHNENKRICSADFKHIAQLEYNKIDIASDVKILDNDNCSADKKLETIFTNRGEVVINKIEYSKTLEGITERYVIDDININPGQSVTIPMEVYTNHGENSFTIDVVSVNNISYGDHVNTNNKTNIKLVYFDPNAGLLNEGFEGYEYEDEGAFTDNAEYVNAISKISAEDFGKKDIKVGGYADSDAAVLVDFYTWDITDNMLNKNAKMEYGIVNLSEVAHPHLVFDYASASDPSKPDKMSIIVSTDCGESNTTIRTIEGNELLTTNIIPNFFIPSRAIEWRTAYVDLSQYVNEDQLVIGFLFQSGFGNALYIDNIKIASYNSTPTLTSDEFTFYPNPTSDRINVSTDYSGTLTLSDINGRVVYQENISKQSSIDVTSMPKGAYLLKFISKEGAIHKKVLIH